jgi:cohesin loading factor subunit SCC2
LCASKQQAEEDYRGVIESFVDDLLVTLDLPEWPASEPLLLAFSNSLLGFLTTNGTQVNSVRSLSLHLLGNIAAKIRMETNKINQSNLSYLKLVS